MAALGQSDIAVTIMTQRRLAPSQKENLVKFVVGDGSKTYPSGGIAIPSDSSLGFSSPVRYLIPVGPRNFTSGVRWEYDHTTGTLRAFRSFTPPVVVEEAVTLTSHAGTLQYVPAFIIAATGTISATVTPLKPVPSTATLAATEIGVNWTTGAVTCKASDSVSALKISYIPLQASGPFSSANIVEESITLATGNNNLTSRAAMFQYAYQTTATAARLDKLHANASGAIAINFESSGNTVISAHSAQNGKAVTFRYLKYAGFQQPGVEWIDEATISLTSEAKEWGKAAGDRVGGLVIPATGGQITGVEGSNFLPIYLGATTVTPAPGVAKFDILVDKITTAETTPQTSIQDTPLVFLSSLYSPEQGDQELYTGYAPAQTTMYFLAVA